MENKYRKVTIKTIHDLKKSHEDKQKVESVNQADLSMRINLSKKTTDELLDEIREQQIKLIKHGLCTKYKTFTLSKRSSSRKRLKNQPPEHQAHHEGQCTIGLFILIGNHQRRYMLRSLKVTCISFRVLEREKKQAKGRPNGDKEWWFL